MATTGLKAIIERPWRLTVRQAGATDAWEEFYGDDQVDTSDPEGWGKALVARFNARLRPHEVAREYVSIEDTRRAA
ncbi:MAG: hypothetical protein ACO1SV_21785 [Fimbriimonas sp.]